MKKYKDHPEEVNIAGEPVVAYQVASHRGEAQFQPDMVAMQEFKIPRDANGKPIGTPWEEVLEEMYDDLSKHYGVDLRTL